MKFIKFIIILHVFFAGCHLPDDRLIVLNNSNNKCFFRIGSNEDLNRNYFMFDDKLLPLKPFENNKYIIYSTWENRFSQNESLTVIVIERLSADQRHDLTKQEYDSIIADKKYYTRKYTYREFENKNWIVNFPFDGFVNAKDGK